MRSENSTITPLPIEIRKVGHGQSQGRRVLIHSFHEFVDDVFKHLDMIRKKHPNLDCFICGHSMGGAISILSASRKPEYFKGVVLIGPCIATNPDLATPLKVKLAKFMRWLAPKFPVGGIDMNQVSSDPKVVKKMKQDPLRFHGFCTAGLGASLLDSCEEIQGSIPTISFPFLICQGEEDKLCIPEGALMMYEKSSSKDKTLKMYPKAYHNLLYEPNGIAQQCTSDILEWLLARV
ncbi:monoglyceride lipase-like isoform X2 [Uloborus diversus]|uniref:monoglyceride lipase-like isoform X2 n=1 Tax=Uloborus diversus TaxID=327109 RepID=UPI002408FBDA|nr:monoglyceride lipase-like isoform X2 [Uloborus diversus]